MTLSWSKGAFVGAILCLGCTARPLVNDPSHDGTVAHPPRGQPVIGLSLQAEAQTFPPLTRSFTQMKIPGVKGQIADISGNSKSDVWLLSSEAVKGYMSDEYGVIYHYDGKKAKSHGHPCLLTSFGSIAAAGKEVALSGSRLFQRSGWPRFIAIDEGKGFPCFEGGMTDGTMTASAGHIWRLECRSEERWVCALMANGAPPVHLPAFDASLVPPESPVDKTRGDGPPMVVHTFWMLSDHDGYLVHTAPDGRALLLRYNGVTWKPLASFGEPGHVATTLWAVPGEAWILMRDADKYSASTMLYRFDGQVVSKRDMPEGFEGYWIEGDGIRGVWIGAKGRQIYQWDGQTLRRGTLPWEVSGGWLAPDGDLWVGATTDKETEELNGVILHTGPLSGEKHP